MNVRKLALCVLSVSTSIATAQIPGADQRWPVKTRDRVDLWLHGFAMISDDSSVLPLFKRGYQDFLTAEKNRAGVVTDLDANRAALAKRLQENPALVNAQFTAFAFANWTDLNSALDAFLQADGDPRQAPNQRAAQQVAALAAVFPARADRDFARRREGRTAAEGKSRNVIAVDFPDAPDHAIDAIYALAHEMVNPLVNAAVADNTTPAEKRSGVVAKLSAIALVRGGALLLKRLSPEPMTNYERFYLHASGLNTGGNTADAFTNAFHLTPALLDSIDRQISVAFGGI